MSGGPPGRTREDMVLTVLCLGGAGTGRLFLRVSVGVPEVRDRRSEQGNSPIDLLLGVSLDDAAFLGCQDEIRRRAR
jgi:hypothetical protein